MSANLLVVDDDRFLLENLRKLLAKQGYGVRTASSGAEGFAMVAEQAPDLLVLDLGLPDTDGVSLCRQLRAKWKFPILMLTARADAMDKVIGLEVGADDYLTKPFEPSELVARVRAQLRRTQEYRDAPTGPAQIEVGPLVLDLESRSVEVGGNPVSLTAREFDLLAYLAKNVGRALSRDTIFESVWGFDPEFNSNSLDVFVYRLRLKIEGAAKRKLLHTVRGFGYKLDPEFMEPSSTG